MSVSKFAPNHNASKDKVCGLFVIFGWSLNKLKFEKRKINGETIMNICILVAKTYS